MLKHMISVALSVGIVGAVQAAPVKWDSVKGGNDHYYELLTFTQYGAFSDALVAASSLSHNGLQGYLATITSAEEQNFLNSSVNPNSEQAWLGGSDAASEGDWLWVTGPEAGVAFSYFNWAPNEPNNCCGGEDGLIGWWSGSSTGGWNDLFDNSGFTGGILVEYSGTQPGTVPLPAGLLLLGTGLAGLGLARRRHTA